MNKALYFLLMVSSLANLQGSDMDPDFDDTPVYVLFTASPGQLASIPAVDFEAYRLLMNELTAFQYRVYDKLLSQEEMPVILKKLQIKSQQILADKNSQQKFNEHIKNVAGYHRILLKQ